MPKQTLPTVHAYTASWYNLQNTPPKIGTSYNYLFSFVYICIHIATYIYPTIRCHGEFTCVKVMCIVSFVACSINKGAGQTLRPPNTLQYHNNNS